MGFKLVLSVSLIVGALGIASTLTDGQDQRAGCQPLKEKGTWSPPTPSPTSAQGNTGCGSKTKKRKSYTDLSEDEKIALRCAMQDIISDGSFGHLANFHGGPHTICSPTTHPTGCCPHGGTDFLTWHRLYLVNFERALEPYLIKYGHPDLGVPYWDWTASLKIPTLFDDLPSHTMLDVAKYYQEWGNFTGGTQEISGNGSFIMRREDGNMVDWTDKLSKWSTECPVNGLHTNSEFLPGEKHHFRDNITSLHKDVENAKQDDIGNFAKEMSPLHGKIHRKMKCTMSELSTASYDPLFWLHHAFVDKIFADWQDSPENYDERAKLSRTLENIEPFNLDANHYKDFTMISPYDSWDYKDKLCYEYCPTGTNCPIDGGTGANPSESAASQNTGRYILTAYVSLVLPNFFGGDMELKHCYSENDCQELDFPCFGDGAIECDQSLTVNKKKFEFLQEVFSISEFASAGGLLSTPPIDVQWTSLLVFGELKDHTPKSAPPFKVFKIFDSNTHAIKRFVQLAPGVSKNQYGDLLDDYDVREYCDKFEVDKSDPFAQKTKYWFNWQLGNANLCTNGGQNQTSR